MNAEIEEIKQALQTSRALINNIKNNIADAQSTVESKITPSMAADDFISSFDNDEITRSIFEEDENPDAITWSTEQTTSSTTDSGDATPEQLNNIMHDLDQCNTLLNNALDNVAMLG